MLQKYSIRFLLLILVVALFSSTTAHAAIITVDTLSDDSTDTTACQLRDAILAANGNTEVDGCDKGDGDDIIRFDVGVGAIVLESNLPTVSGTLDIQGPGQQALNIDGDGAYRVLLVGGGSGRHFTIRNITLYQGFANAAGCMYVGVVESLTLDHVKFDLCDGNSGIGGALFVEQGVGTVTTDIVIKSSIFENNITSGSGGAVAAVPQDGTLLIEDSLFLNNKANGSSSTGGALTIGSTTKVTIKRSTFWGNEATEDASAIAAVSAAVDVTLSHSTISENDISGASPTSVGAIRNSGTLTMFNTVVARNTEGGSYDGVTDVNNKNTIISQGFNYIGSNVGSATDFPAGTNGNGDVVGTGIAPIDPRLGPIQDNGGPTLTSMPDLDSDLIDSGSCDGDKRDQRGYLNTATGFRVVDIVSVTDVEDGCDKGAVERDAMPQVNDVFKDGFESEA